MQRPDERELREQLARLRAEHRDLDARDRGGGDVAPGRSVADQAPEEAQAVAQGPASPPSRTSCCPTSSPDILTVDFVNAVLLTCTVALSSLTALRFSRGAPGHGRTGKDRHHHGQPVGLADDEARRRCARRAGRRLRGQGGLGPPHAQAPLRVRRGRQGAGPQGDHRRCRRRRAPAGHDGRHDAICLCSAYRLPPRRCRDRTACCPSCRCRPACPSARSPSAMPAPPTPACSRPRSWRSRTMSSPSGSRPCAPSRRHAADVPEAPKDDA